MNYVKKTLIGLGIATGIYAGAISAKPLENSVAKTTEFSKCLLGSTRLGDDTGKVASVRNGNAVVGTSYVGVSPSEKVYKLVNLGQAELENELELKNGMFGRGWTFKYDVVKNSNLMEGKAQNLQTLVGKEGIIQIANDATDTLGNSFQIRYTKTPLVRLSKDQYAFLENKYGTMWVSEVGKGTYGVYVSTWNNPEKVFRFDYKGNLDKNKLKLTLDSAYQFEVKSGKIIYEKGDLSSPATRKVDYGQVADEKRFRNGTMCGIEQMTPFVMAGPNTGNLKLDSDQVKELSGKDVLLNETMVAVPYMNDSLKKSKSEGAVQEFIFGSKAVETLNVPAQKQFGWEATITEKIQILYRLVKDTADKSMVSQPIYDYGKLDGEPVMAFPTETKSELKTITYFIKSGTKLTSEQPKGKTAVDNIVVGKNSIELLSKNKPIANSSITMEDLQAFKALVENPEVKKPATKKK